MAKPLIIDGLAFLNVVITGYYLANEEFRIGRDMDRAVLSLSQGQQQRLTLKLCYTDVKIWLLDEPYNALDEMVLSCNALIKVHLDVGSGVVYSSHNEQYVGSRVNV